MPNNPVVLDGIGLMDVLALPWSVEHAAGIDAGGSRFRGWLVDRDGTPVREVEYRNRDLQSLSDGLVRFLAECGVRPARICLGITGVGTADGNVRQTNVPAWWPDFNWISASDVLGTEIVTINDVGAAALAMRRLKDRPECNRTILPGEPVPAGKILTVALGTGLGDAYLDGGYVGQGEPGHHPFSPRDEVEDELLRFTRRELGDDIVSFEDLLSGSRGLHRLYRFYGANADLAEQEFLRLLPGAEFRRNPAVWRRLALEPDQSGYKPPPEVISETGMPTSLADFDPVGFLALVRLGDVFGTYLAARAVAVAASGGVKLIGGVLTGELIELWLRHSRFAQRIRNMGVHRAMAARLQVDWVTHPYPGLVGAVEAALALAPGTQSKGRRSAGALRAAVPSGQVSMSRG
jgi:glucokinase